MNDAALSDLEQQIDAAYSDLGRLRCLPPTMVAPEGIAAAEAHLREIQDVAADQLCARLAAQLELPIHIADSLIADLHSLLGKARG